MAALEKALVNCCLGRAGWLIMSRASQTDHSVSYRDLLHWAFIGRIPGHPPSNVEFSTPMSRIALTDASIMVLELSMPCSLPFP